MYHIGICIISAYIHAYVYTWYIHDRGSRHKFSKVLSPWCFSLVLGKRPRSMMFFISSRTIIFYHFWQHRLGRRRRLRPRPLWCVHMSVCLRVRVSASLCVCVSGCLRVSVRFRLSLSLCMNVWMCECVWMCVCVNVCECVYVWMCVCVGGGACRIRCRRRRLRVCVCVCV